jgi:hypothetical protein
MRTPRLRPLLLALAMLGAGLAAVGCQSTEFTYLDAAGPDTAADVAPSDATDDGTAEVGDVSHEPSPAGGPCKADKDCFEKGKCFTTQVVNQMFDPAGAEPDVEVPGGMCTRLMCSNDDACGPGGKCFDASPLTGGTAMKLCGWPCIDPGDCRWKEGYNCYFTGKTDEVQICLPQGLIDIIDCGNGVCDNLPEQNYVETHDTCPRDCP